MTVKPGFRLGVYVFKDAEIVDYAAPHGVFSVARVMEYAEAYELYRGDRLITRPEAA